jgi:hypothetical protein
VRPFRRSFHISSAAVPDVNRRVVGIELLLAVALGSQGIIFEPRMLGKAQPSEKGAIYFEIGAFTNNFKCAKRQSITKLMIERLAFLKHKILVKAPIPKRIAPFCSI